MHPEAVNGMVYGCSWYLDIVCPEWEALVQDDYEAIFPLTCNRKFGIRYLYQPFFTQQLGIFSRGLLSGELVEKFLDAIPVHFRFAEINLIP